MKRDLKINRFAKKLVNFSKENGVVTEAKVTEVLGALRQIQPRNYLQILKVFIRYIRREIALQTAIVSTPVSLSEAGLKAIEAHFTKEYNRPVNAVLREDAELIAGVCVRVGDDVYDASIAGQLQRLAENVH